MTDSQSGAVEVGGARLAYDIAGAGPPLALIHAGIADRRMWDELMPLLSAHHQVVRYDTRGFGGSHTEAVEYSNRDDLRALLTHLEIERTAVLGISRGGSIAIDFTLEYPELVTALIPVAAGLAGYDVEPTPAEAAMWEEAERLEAARDWDALDEFEMDVWVEGPGQPRGRAPEAIRTAVSRMNRALYDEHTTEPTPRPLDPPAALRLGEIDVPTLVIVGDLDTSDTQATAVELERRIPGARRVVFPGTAHMVPMERPVAFTRTVLDFLAGVAR